MLRNFECQRSETTDLRSAITFAEAQFVEHSTLNPNITRHQLIVISNCEQTQDTNPNEIKSSKLCDINKNELDGFDIIAVNINAGDSQIDTNNYLDCIADTIYSVADPLAKDTLHLDLYNSLAQNLNPCGSTGGSMTSMSSGNSYSGRRLLTDIDVLAGPIITPASNEPLVTVTKGTNTQVNQAQTSWIMTD